MPYKSKAQMRLMFAKESAGEVKKGTALRWAHETKNIKGLPEHKKKRSHFVERLKKHSGKHK